MEPESFPPTYGEGFGLCQVRIRKPFEPHGDFVVGIIGARSDDFVGGEKTLNQPIIVGAAAGVDAGQVRIRALGELVERVSAVRSGRRLFDGAHDVSILPMSGSTGPKLKMIPVGCYPGAVRDISWAVGVDLVDGRCVLLPAELCHLQLAQSGSVELHLAGNGLAAHRTKYDALRRAITEGIERHQLMGSWHLAGWHVTVQSVNEIPSALAQIRTELGQVYRLFELRHGSLPPVTIAMVSQHDGSRFTLGSSCGQSAPGRAEHALSEALMLQHSVLNTMAGRTAYAKWSQYDGMPRNSMEHVLMYFDDGQEVIDWYDRQARSFGRGLVSTVAASDESIAGPGDLALAIQQTLGSTTFSAVVSDARAKQHGWHVYRALVPGALAYQPGHLPEYQVEALDRVSMAMPELVGGFNASPHPFG